MIPALAILLTLAPHNAPEGQIGFVMNLHGDWSVNGSAVIRGQAVPPGGKVRLTAMPKDGRPASISVILLNNRSVHLTCETPGACEKGAELPSSMISSPSGFERLTRAALTLFGQRPARYVPMLARGSAAGAPAPAESVAKKDPGGVLMGPAMGSLPAGRYLLEFFPVAADSAEIGPKAASAELNWIPAGPGRIPATGLSDGLYQLVPSAGSQKAGGLYRSTVWVLVVGAERYSEASGAFGEIRAAVDQWDPAVPASARRSFLRASLESLAGTPR